MSIEQDHRCPVTPITDGPKHHFFGYYDKCPWDASGRYVLAMEAPFRDRNPHGDEPVTIGVVDLANDNSFRPLAESRAWNWQQGSMLRWWPGRPSVAMFNNRVDDELVTTTVDIESAVVQTAGPALYDISADGRWGATLNFARTSACRPGYGYFGLTDPTESCLQPDDDGLSIVDLATGEQRLLTTIRAANEVGRVLPTSRDRVWFNHLTFNPGATRILYLHRWAESSCPGHLGFETRLLTIGLDGSSPRCVTEGYGASHFNWLDDEHLLIFLYHPDGDGYYLIHEPTGEMEPVGQHVFSVDGHCVYRPQGDWFVTDTYPQGNGREQHLMLYHVATQRCIEVGAFPAMPVDDPSCRCDLHTRWHHDGTKLCFDSTHGGSRQMYVMDVSTLVG